jgi:two-component system nitrate/nitrite response regulator NarL
MKDQPASEPLPIGRPRPIRVIVVDDHPVVRKGLCACLARTETIAVIGEAWDGHDAIQKAAELSPDLMVMDIDMPVMNGLTATEVLRKELPQIKILVLSIHSEPDHVVRILQCGANGYLLKTAPPTELVKAIETIHGGEVYFSPEVSRIALNHLVGGSRPGPQLTQLSKREREVLMAVAEGMTNKEIATRLGVGVRTVETHRERIMRKLSIHTVAGLTRFAIQKGLITLQGHPQPNGD